MVYRLMKINERLLKQRMFSIKMNHLVSFVCLIVFCFVAFFSCQLFYFLYIFFVCLRSKFCSFLWFFSPIVFQLLQILWSWNNQIYQEIVWFINFDNFSIETKIKCLYDVGWRCCANLHDKWIRTISDFFSSIFPVNNFH